MSEKPQTTDFGLYAMKLHDIIAPDTNTLVRRVAGGWVYSDMHGSCFVPFDNEFQEGGRGNV